MLQKLDDAVSVEDVSTAEACAAVSSEFTRVADAAQLIFVESTLVVGFSTLCVKAGLACALTFDALALVAAFELLVAEVRHVGVLFLGSITACIDELHVIGSLFSRFHWAKIEHWNLDDNLL